MRFLVGAVVLLALYFVLRVARYALVGLWAGLGAPWLFRRLRLAPSG